MKLKLIICLIGILAGIGFASAWSFARNADLIKHQDGGILANGNPVEAERRLGLLMTHLKAVNFDWSQISLEEQILPDQIYSDQKWIKSLASPTLDKCRHEVYRDQVVFTTSLYTESKFTYLGGDSGKVDKKGFYLVGWKDGHINRVSIHDVRWYPTTTDDGKTQIWISVFPGMSSYSKGIVGPYGRG